MIDIPNVQWEGLSGVLPPTSQKMFKGVNKLDRFSIEGEYATETKNLSSKAFPALTVRDGHSLLGSALPKEILGLGTWKDLELHAVSNNNWYRHKSNVWSSLASGLSATANWSYCNFKGSFPDFNLIGSNGVDPIKKYNGTTVSNLANAPSGGNFVDAHDGRVYCAVENMVKFSALNAAEDWTDTDPYVGSGTIRINDESGNNIVGLKAGTEHLLTFFPSATYELYGTGPDDYRMIRVAEDVGLLSNQCVVSVAGVIYWADINGIYRYTGGSRPKRDFAFPVQKYIDGINKANKHKCTAGTDGKRFYFSLPYGNSESPNITLEYDPEFSGTWYVWENMWPLHFANLKNELYFGDILGWVHKVGGTTDRGTQIGWNWVSKPFGSNIGSQNIRLYKLWVISDVPAGSTFNVYLSGSDQGEDWVKVNSLTPKSRVQKHKIIVPVNQVSNADYVRIKLEGTGPMNVHEIVKTMREMPL